MKSKFKRTNDVYIYKKTTYERDYKIAVKMHNDTFFNIASFDNMEQFEIYRKTLGFKINLVGTINENTENEVKIYRTNYKIIDYHCGGFWKLEEVPERAKPFKALSNGSIVTCYYYKNCKDNTIVIYRPNPNAEKVYKPLSVDEHIAHQKIYGCY